MTKPATIPIYRGLDHVGGAFPAESEAWPKFKTRQTVDASGDFYDIALDEVREYADTRPWAWPAHTIYFLCDQHADADAFFRSLVASGGVAKTGTADADFELTEEGSRATFVIGGDCLDKGPNNLRLLRVVRTLMEKGARVEILAGNHDVRALVGLVYMGRKEPWLAHLFIRMGQKAIPLFREVYEAYLKDRDTSNDEAHEDRLRELLFPSESWYADFPRAVAGLVPDKMIHKEVARIREKVQEFEVRRAAQGLSLAMILAAAEKARDLFLDPQSEYAFYFRRMKLLLHAGSFLFVHAGVDDVVAQALERDGADVLNERFRHLMQENLFELYNGPIGNAFRTKYRDSDFHLSQEGVDALHRAGIQAIVHGHRNIPRGQRQVLRGGILNFECDASVDQNTRKRLGLVGVGGAVTIVRAQGSVTGISTDYPYAKHFDATAVLDERQLRLGWTESAVEARAGASADTSLDATAASADTSADASADVSAATPVDTPADAPADASADMPTHVSADVSDDSSADASISTPAATSADESAEPIADTSADPIANTSAEASAGASADASADVSADVTADTSASTNENGRGNGGGHVDTQSGRDKFEKAAVKFENTMALDEAVSYFEAIVAGFKKGTINLRSGDRNVTLTPTAHVEVEVKAVSKKKKEGITFEIMWKTPEQSALTISSK